MNRRWWYVTPLMAACISTLTVADDRADYNRLSAERYIAMFRLADFNKDNVVTVGEAQGIIELQAHFNDIDTDRDGDITWDELTHYIEGAFR
jgi:Ca2+-binding EF-hand superfamily protein